MVSPTNLSAVKLSSFPEGIVNFIDARTQWIDDGMKKALDDGIKQVGQHDLI
jgi:O-methyltransferase involved in polyketide biosynthesis